MAEFDFKSIHAVMGAVLGSGGVILTFKDFFEKPGVLATELVARLENAVPPGPSWVRERRKAVRKSLLSIPRLFLSLFFLSLIAGSGIVLAVGPENLDPEWWGPLSESLTQGEKLVYLIILIPIVATYLWKVSTPAWRGWVAMWRASCWLHRRKASP